MARNYVFLPVPSVEMLQSAGYVADYWRPLTILRNPYLRGRMKGIWRFFKGCLGGLAADDKLFILIHQYYGGAAASRHPDLRQTAHGWEHDHDDLKVYDAAGLAKVLAAEGLPRTCRDIYACTCNSALRHPAADQPFAQALCAALRDRNYAGVTVTGFRGFFRPGRFGVYVEVNGDLVRINDANTIKTTHADISQTYGD